METIREALNNNDLRKDLLKSVVGMEMTDENIKKLSSMVVECHSISQEAMVEHANIWTEHPTMVAEDPNYQRSMYLQSLNARSEMFSGFILNHLETKLSPEKFDAICMAIDEIDMQNNQAYTRDPETNMIRKGR